MDELGLAAYRAMAAAFAAEGVKAHFTLMGDGNMHFATSLAEEHGIRTIHARHEHCACAMAMGYARAVGGVGVASVTMGPGFTQTATALTSAARGGVPLIVFAGDIPTISRWYHQRFEQAPLAAAAGAHHIPVRSAGRALEAVREAFYTARVESRPVVLSVPLDLQKQALAGAGDYTTSARLIPRLAPPPPDAADVEAIVRLIEESGRPIFIAGRGVLAAQARDAVEALAERCGALLSTTLHMRGMFDANPFSLGIAGGFSSDVAREQFAEADLVIAFGASLGHHTSDGGSLYPKACVVQIDLAPHGMHQGLRIAHMHVRADARLAAEAILSELEARGIAKTGVRGEALKDEIRTHADEAAFDLDPGTLDPRAAVKALDMAIPKDWAIVGASGHSFFFTATGMRGRRPEDFFSFKDFGEIGSHLSYAIGVAVARGDGKVAVIDGDGSLIMHIQELETIARHGVRLLIVALNDGAYGAELHKLRVQKHHPQHAIFGRPDFGRIAEAFGLRGATITSTDQIPELFRGHAKQDRAEMWNLHISQNVVAPHYRRRHGAATPTKARCRARVAAA